MVFRWINVLDFVSTALPWTGSSTIPSVGPRPFSRRLSSVCLSSRISLIGI